MAAMLVWLLCAAGPVSARAELVNPLDVPRGSGLEPEDLAHLPVQERIERSAAALQERGYRNLPVLAWALLDHSRGLGSPALIARAVELAPSNPGIHYEAAWQSRNVTHLVRAIASLGTSFPALVWLASLVGAALGVGICALALLVVLITFVRTIGLHGHVMGHLTSKAEPSAWPGVLLVLCALALLPLWGIGPALLVAAAGGLAGLRLQRSESVAVAGVLALAGGVLGPGLDAWSRIAAIQGRDPMLRAAWRVETAQPLAGDRERLERVVAARPDDLFLRVVLATAWLREGRIDRVEEVLGQLPASAPAVLLSRADNLRGTALLARGDVDGAIAAFESGRATRESAALLYNLSQAYGRAVRLSERSALFSAARDLDPELISRHASIKGANVHHFVIQEPLPLLAYLKRGFRPSSEGQKLASTVRSWTLGPGMPEWAWLLLPGAGLIGVVGRRRSIWRCSRCERPVCQRCLPEDAALGSTCLRCARLFASKTVSDPRMRKRQLELDRRRQRRLGTTLAALALVLPGVGRVIEGRVSAGGLRLFALTVALSLVGMPRVIAAPVELGGLAAALSSSAASLLLVPVVLAAFLEARSHLGRARSR